MTAYSFLDKLSLKNISSKCKSTLLKLEISFFNSGISENVGRASQNVSTSATQQQNFFFFLSPGNH